MNENIRLLMLEAGYAAPELATRGQELVALVIHEVLLELENQYGPTDEIPLEEIKWCLNNYFGTTE